MSARLLWDEKWKCSALAAALEDEGDEAGATMLREREKAAQEAAVALETKALERAPKGHHPGGGCSEQSCVCGFAMAYQDAQAAVWRRAMWRALDGFDCGCGRSRCSECRGIALVFRLAHKPEVANG